MSCITHVSIRTTIITLHNHVKCTRCLLVHGAHTDDMPRKDCHTKDLAWYTNSNAWDTYGCGTTCLTCDCTNNCCSQTCHCLHTTHTVHSGLISACMHTWHQLWHSTSCCTARSAGDSSNLISKTSSQGAEPPNAERPITC